MSILSFYLSFESSVLFQILENIINLLLLQFSLFIVLLSPDTLQKVTQMHIKLLIIGIKYLFEVVFFILLYLSLGITTNRKYPSMFVFHMSVQSRVRQICLATTAEVVSLSPSRSRSSFLLL